ncbi:MAG: carotenoid biosynthesis protein [Bacteroidetes bacterium]|jgi:putative membrane protein|nr:carotenoid biosynthesis protein [Bacteroidota bacterium]
MNQKTERLLIYVYALLFLVGIAGYSIASIKPMIHQTTEIFLFVTAIPAMIVLWLHQERKTRYAVMVVLLIATTIFIEIIGVKTGIIFGQYEYGSTFGLKIYQVPVIIGINWCVLIMAANTILTGVRLNQFVSITLAALLIVVFDVLLEPVAMQLDYWQWEENRVPLQNYIAWFIISWLAGWTMRLLNIRLTSPLMVSYFLFQMILFIYLNILILTGQNQGLI